MAAEEEDDLDRVNGLLCGAVKLLRGQRAKPDQLLYLALMFLAKSKSYIFSGEIDGQVWSTSIMSELVSLLQGYLAAISE